MNAHNIDCRQANAKKLFIAEPMLNANELNQRMLTAILSLVEFS